MVSPLFFDNREPLLIIEPQSQKILEVNEAAVQTYGFSKKEFLAKTMAALQTEKETVAVLNCDKNTEKDFHPLGTVKHKDNRGNVFAVKLFTHGINFKGGDARLVKVELLHSKKNRFIHKAEQQLQKHLANSPLAYGLWDDSFRLIKFSDKVSRWLGYTKEELLGENSIILASKYVREEDLLRVQQKIEALLSGKETNSRVEFGVKAKDGTYKHLKFYNSALTNDQGQLVSVLSLVEDKTELIKNRRAKQQAVEKFRYIAENAQDNIAIFDGEANCIYASPSTKSLLGLTPEEYKETNILDSIHPDDRAMIKQNMRELKKGEGKRTISYRIRHKDGRFIWVETKIKPIFNEHNELKEIHTAARDISDRMKFELKLQQESRFIEKAINSFPGLFYVLDEDGKYVRINDNFKKELGFSLAQLQDLTPLHFYHDEDHERISKEIEKAFSGGEAHTTARLKTQDGSLKWYHLTGSQFTQGEKNYILGTGINITPRIKAQKKLKYKSTLLTKLFDNAPIGIALVAQEGQVLEINKQFEVIFGYSRAEAEGQDIFSLISPRIDETQPKKVLHESNISFNEEIICLHKDGNKVPVLTGFVPINPSDTQGPTVSYRIFVDITERKKNLEEIKSSLQEKKTLLQEVHHRVKNNLAVVSSLLQLQKFSTDNKALAKALTDSEMRIQAMAMIHEQLYGVESLSEIPIRKYGAKLAASIKEIYDPSDDITLQIDSDDFKLNVNQALPFALILNELLSNSFEHAFDSQTSGKIELEVTHANDEVILCLTDNGKGIPSNFRPEETTSLGYTVVDTLVQQLEGELNIDSGAGTMVRLSFERENTRGSGSWLME